MKKVFIGGAWPYANGSLHVGHVAALLPGDILARYFRQTGAQVLYVSGSDCHGTPITLSAEAEGVSPEVIAERNHARFESMFHALGFSYDRYTRTDAPWHKVMVETFFRKLYDAGVVTARTVEQVYCPHCARFLPDRFIEGTCPACGGHARGDQCDDCETLIDPLELKDARCRICGGTPETAQTEHLFLRLSELEPQLSRYARERQADWNRNAVRLTERFFEEGLRDRAVTRDLSWGVDVPVEGFQGKKLYVWIDAVLGYLSASMLWSETSGMEWEDFWLDDSRGERVAYYVHGKDNIPFHTIILPALLMGVGSVYGAPLHLPDRIVSSEHMTLEGKKLSKSAGWAVWVDDLLTRYPADSLRYYLTANAPERRDSDFSFQAFVHAHNGELLGNFGNFVNRTLQFIERFRGGVVPCAAVDSGVRAWVEALYPAAGARIEKGQCREALEVIFSGVRRANQWYDAQQPWVTRQGEPEKCDATLLGCVEIIANLANLLEPFLPFSCARIRAFLCEDAPPTWAYREAKAGIRLKDVEALYPRIDVGAAQEELARISSGNEA